MSHFNELPDSGFLRLSSIIAPSGPIPVSKSTWWAGIKDGRFPKPVKLGARITVWRVADIRSLIENGAR
jgi:prophage regulatory protein